jgi:outer membrane protein OmpA-like peptidoglycan-associated protein
MNKAGRLIIMSVTGLSVALAAFPAQAGLYEKGGANGVGARAMGVAGAYSALAEDETAVWWNPAGLGGVDTLRLGSSLGSQYDGRIRSFNFSAASPLTAGSAAGFSWQHDFYTQAADLNSDALLLAGSLPLSEDRRLNLGASLKILFGGIQKTEATYSGLGLDLGLRYKMALPSSQSLVIGLGIQDPDTQLTWSNGSQEEVPMSLVLGTAWALRPDTSAVLDLESIQASQGTPGTQILRMGVEYWLREPLALRAGFILDSRQASTFTLGAGYKYAEWQVEYAFLGMVANLGLSHRLTVSYGLPAFTAVVAKKPVPVATATPVPAAKPSEYAIELVAMPEVFSPNHDGIADTVIFNSNVKEGDLAAVASWHLTLVNQDDQIVRELAGKEYAEQVEWDGADSQGETCPDGTYLAKFLLLDAKDNRLGYAEVPVAIRTRLPRFGLQIVPDSLTLIAGRPERALRFHMTKNNEITESGWQLVIRSEEGATLKTFKGRGQVPASVTWNGQLANQAFIGPGRYQAILTITDTIGLQMSNLQMFDVVALEPQVSLDITPRLLRPGSKLEGTAHFKFKVEPKDKSVSWKLEIRDVETRKLTKTAGQEGLPPETMDWDCRDNQGTLVKNGAYFQAQLAVKFRGQMTVKSNPQALATDMALGETGQALALHLTTVLFASASDTIPLDAYKYLKQAAETIKKYAKRYHVQVKGYTDSEEALDRELELSWERARKVREYLGASCGIPQDKMEAAGYGSKLPLAPENSSAGRAKNRRVEVVLIIEK